MQKPIKCNKSNHLKPEVDPMLWNLYDELPIFSSKKCEADEISIPFEIRGNGIGVENGVLVLYLTIGCSFLEPKILLLSEK